MAAISLVSIDMITREALRIAHEKLSFIGTVDRQYDSSFAKSGAKIGDTLRVRRPNQYLRTKGSRVMDVQDQDEVSSSITNATQDHVDMRFNSAERALTIDEMSKRYIEPAVSVLASGIEADFLAFATKATYQVAGTAGTAITDLVATGAARAKLNQQLAPKDDNRCIQMDSVTMGGLVNGVTGYFNPTNALGEQYREGLVARTSMANFYENERTWSLTNTADVTGTTDAAAGVTDGGTAVTMGATVASPAVGSVFTIAGVYDCHPETKAAYPHLKQFTVVTTAATTALVISPATILTGARQNVVTSTGGTLLTTDFNSKTLTFVGAASTTYNHPLMYHKEAFQFVTADLPILDSAEKCTRRIQDGLSMRVWQDGDIRNDELLMRIDILYGMAALRPEWACRLVGSAAV